MPVLLIPMISIFEIISLAIISSSYFINKFKYTFCAILHKSHWIISFSQLFSIIIIYIWIQIIIRFLLYNIILQRMILLSLGKKLYYLNRSFIFFLYDKPEQLFNFWRNGTDKLKTFQSLIKARVFEKVLSVKQPAYDEN